jgi:hypothetical protein
MPPRLQKAQKTIITNRRQRKERICSGCRPGMPDAQLISSHIAKKDCLLKKRFEISPQQRAPRMMAAAAAATAN